MRRDEMSQSKWIEEKRWGMRWDEMRGVSQDELMRREEMRWDERWVNKDKYKRRDERWDEPVNMNSREER